MVQFRFAEVIENFSRLAPYLLKDLDPTNEIAVFTARGMPVQIVVWIDKKEIRWTTNSCYFARLIMAC